MNRIQWQSAAIPYLADLPPSARAEEQAAAILTPLLEAVAGALREGDIDAIIDFSLLPGEITGGKGIGKQLRGWSSLPTAQLTGELAKLRTDPAGRAEIDALLAAIADTKPAPPAGDTITRDKIEVQPGGHYQPGWTVEKVENITNPLPPDPVKERAADAEATYLRRLRVQSNALPLAQDNRAAGDRDKGSRTPELSRVYVDLKVASGPGLENVFQRLSVPIERRNDLREKLLLWAEEYTEEKEPFYSVDTEGFILGRLERWSGNRDQHIAPEEELFAYVNDPEKIDSVLTPLSALEALEANRRLVLLGDPGGGKSTFVNHLAYLCAGARLGEETGWQAALDNLFPTPLLPLRVIVRRWSSRLTARDAAGPELVYAALMEETGLERDALLQRLNQPDTLVLLDGLDEAPGADPNDPASKRDEALDRRRTIVESVDAFCAERPSCRVLVTCRIKPYEQPAYRLKETPDFTLAPLDDPRIERFLRNWYGEMARTGASSPDKAEADREQLQAALAQRPDLREMAEIPLLATMLARVNARSGLPDNRADLYHECVEQLLWEWEAAKSREGGERAGLVDLLQADGVGLKRGDVERVLWEMTFAAHAQSGAESADLPADALRAKLAAIHPQRHDGWAWADQVVALMAERSGLLVDTGVGTFSFPHRTFQEYLAARWLLEQADCPQQAARLAGSDTWREVVLLACGYATSNSAYNTTQAILFELLGDGGFATEEARRRLLVAGQGWLEFGPHRAVGATGERLKREMPPLLTRLMQSRDVPPKERLEAGLILADLHILPEDLDEFVELPPTETVPYAFRIGKYPVTNAQYRRFVEAGGYDEGQPWWTEKAVAELDQYAVDWRAGPRYLEDADFNHSTQPVVGVSWYECVAYCVWLTGELRRKGKINSEAEVRLPTEAEWERVARSVHSQEYPWGGGFDPSSANTAESKLDRTSPVHQYPGGATPEGVWDLAGNVYEWTWQIDKRGRVPLRGGAFWREANYATASERGRLGPNSRNDGRGFRCVCLPLSRGDSAFCFLISEF